LAELTAKGIELLDNEKGFFMMVEGGMVDWAGHANDAASNLGEVLALDEAVSVALDFAKKDTQTLVIVTGDHETGGMTMGFAGTGYKMNLESLALQKCSGGRLDKLIAAANPETFEDVKPILEENLSFSFGGDAKDGALQITPAELKILTEAFESGREKRRYRALVTAVKNIFSHKCGVGWTTGAHTALPVLTSAVGPGADKFIGFIDNTDISKKIKELLK
jgi:alkaline phosphatase